MNCKTCDYRGESPISGMCEGCVNGSKHSQSKKTMLQDRLNKLMDESRQSKPYKREMRKWELVEENAALRAMIDKMKCCENCKHYSDVGEFSPDYVCHVVKEKCAVEKYESWELKASRLPVLNADELPK
jgi:hypothetical protein